MNTAIINIKVASETKKQAQTVAKELGLTLSSLINVCLKEVIRTGELHASVVKEMLNDQTIQAFKEAQEHITSSEFKERFSNNDEAIAHLKQLTSN